MGRFVGKVSTKGQITLPSELRSELGIKPGDKVTISFNDGDIVVRRMKTLKDIYMSIPALKTPMSLKQMKEIAWEEAVNEHLFSGRNQD